ncbi:sulfatase family protein [Parapedobacter sp. 10938]|uniref:sulfatase family protein n=1 Tax=Parapedobacter flavus TaxID=3110225 RepID=UPI002DBA876E|nr:sulfatase [Parapedobacter sp. 10938]MEC3881059.1 sulfatase [Parapedobacter sp. 10938]
MKTWIVVICVTLGIAGACMPENERVAKQPNIIYIMSDDHGYQAVSAYGHGMNETPNIDRIAAEGVLFTRATVTNSLCAPSRAVLLTGKHSFINGKIDNMAKFDWSQDNFPKLLQAAGYQTAMVGKIHMDGLPRGFDYSAVVPGQGDYYNPDFLVNGEKERIHGYVTDITTDLALEWLDSTDKDKPFCLLLHHKAPHREWLAAERHYKEYTKMTFPEPETLFDDYEGRGTAAKTAEMNILKDMNWAGDSKIKPEVMDKLGIPSTLNWDKQAYQNNLGRMDSTQRAAWDAVYDPIIADFESRYQTMSKADLMRWRYQRYMQDYLGTVAAVDDGVGRVLDYLKEHGLEENTIVVYTSDQGFYMGEHGWFDKRFMYEQSLRTPLMIRYPKEIKAGMKTDALVQNLDFAPTFLDYAGVEVPTNMQGESFRKLVSGEAADWRDAIYYTYYEYPSIHMVKRHYGIRTDRYKLIHFYYDVDEWELYDLESDPQEMRNVYGDPAYKDIRETLHKKLEELRVQYNDSDANNQKYIDAHLERRK